MILGKLTKQENITKKRRNSYCTYGRNVVHMERAGELLHRWKELFAGILKKENIVSAVIEEDNIVVIEEDWN